MSVHDRDKTGKTRIRCSAVRESGSCSNGPREGFKIEVKGKVKGKLAAVIGGGVFPEAIRSGDTW